MENCNVNVHLSKISQSGLPIAVVAGRAKRRRPVRNSTRVTPPLELVSDGQEQRKSRKKGALSEASELDEPESQVDTQLDEMYSLIGTRVPPCSYDSSDFEDGHKFSVRMSNYLSWLVVEHHICVYEQFKSYTRQERKTALEKRLKQYSMSDAIVELILSRENGIWDAVTCMNLDKRKMETIRMRRFIRDNETIPLPLDWPIMKFVAHIEMLRSRSFENAQETTKYVKSRTKARRAGRRKKRQPPKPKNKSLSDELEEELDPPQNDSLADAWNSRDPEGEEILPEIEEGAQNSEETASSKKNQPLNEEKSDSANPQEPSLFQTNQQMTESESPADIFEEISKELDLVADGPSSNSAEENPNLPTVQNKVVQENTELRHKVVYLGSRCEQLEVELAQTKDYLKSEIQKEKSLTQKEQETVQVQQANLKELEKRIASLDLELMEAKERADDVERELRAVRQLQAQRNGKIIAENLVDSSSFSP
ncbi:Oidioi.mRNA.OKI2018_I69.XSR.g13420.t1.cds [Oikopleura dioica]|uniref:Oidioi.mRNA.OKI2018_I69.XSR.g13420.t1.cds n=1 Tax=Oikopleura dioica TaxID=34765 RepID=A0ABN7S6T7_OIKDI|nr:Oidioi.mRNA.OKI2018_I69.XSR.g13420.t1.cds [Oikopleura dioica]